MRAAAAGRPGALARLALGPGPAARVLFDVAHQDGAGPDPATLAHVTRAVGDASAKPIEEATSAIAGTGRPWSDADLVALADDPARAPQGGGRIAFHLFFLHGSYGGDTSVLGVTVRADVLAVFADRVQAAATPIVAPATIEEAVSTHEVGHALGLVDLVLDRGRDDPNHPGHSTNPRSVMYWAIESDLVTQVLTGPPPTDFDDADRADLATLHQGA